MLFLKILKNFIYFLYKSLPKSFSRFFAQPAPTYEYESLTPSLGIFSLAKYVRENTYLLRFSFLIFGFHNRIDNNVLKSYVLNHTTRSSFLNPVSTSVLNQVENLQVKKSVHRVTLFKPLARLPLEKTEPLSNSFFANKNKPVNYLTGDPLMSYSSNPTADFIKYFKLFQPAPFKDPLNNKKKYHKKQKQFPIKGGAKVSNKVIEKMIQTGQPVAPFAPAFLTQPHLFQSTTVGPYGYLSFPKDKKVLGRRLWAFDDKSSVKNLNDLNSKTGFLNSSFFSDEHYDNSADVIFDSNSFGRFYAINPFLVLGYLLYAIFEFFFALFLLIKITGTPLELFSFFLKYHDPYFYSNLTNFPSPAFIFGSMVLWFNVFLIFIYHVLELIDSEEFDPPQFSWFFYFFYQLFYIFFVSSICLFISIELFQFFELLITRVFFIGSVGYPQLFNIFYSFLTDIFRLLSSFTFFSTIFENFFSYRTNLITYYFSDFIPFMSRKSLVQPDFLVHSISYRPNFFVQFFSSFFNHLGSQDMLFFESRTLYRRELVQDIRKYNFLRRQWFDFQLAAHLHSHGFNNRNFRLDLENFHDSRLAIDDTHSFDWRFQRKIAKFPLQTFADRSKAKRPQPFLGNFFANFEPSSFLYPTIKLTTFSSFQDIKFTPYLNNISFLYPFGIFFAGFGKLHTLNFPFKFVEFDNVYFNNHNILSSLYSRYFKSLFYRSLNVNTPSLFGGNIPNTNLGFYFNEDSLYPILPQFRLKEKLVPLNFYISKDLLRSSNFFFDPYYTLYKEFFSPSAYFYLDLKVQNWFNFTNVMWNQNYHFFFKRSFKSELSGMAFRLSNSSYKLYVGSVSLTNPRIGQYFHNYVPWLQYKFKWLLYPTSTYKRFDNQRYVQRHTSKKFYFASLLKFYQVHFFRWQLAAKSSQFRIVQSRNFLLHLFFSKRNNLEFLSSLNSFFTTIFTNKNTILLAKSESTSLSQISFLNHLFSNIIDLPDYDLSFAFIPNFSYNSQKTFFLHNPNFSLVDFRLFQHSIDLRRFSALHPLSVKFWYFDRYLKFLGPLFSRSDITSLMGFFAPFEYRNQVLLSRVRNDALRFSVFFPSKISNSLQFLKRGMPQDFIRFRSQDPLNNSNFGPLNDLQKYPRSLLRSWNLGQGWLKFIVPQTINAPQRRYMTLFNFGLSGVGRLPRLSRSYFHMLFFRNKIQDFIALKTSFLKLQMMSLPFLFLYSRNRSFNLFWSSLLFSESGNIRYSILFDSNSNKHSSVYVDPYSIINSINYGTLFNFTSGYLHLHNQYAKIKAFERFSLFSEYPIQPFLIHFSNYSKLPSFNFLKVLFPEIPLSSEFFISKVKQKRVFKFSLHWYLYPLAYYSIVLDSEFSFVLHSWLESFFKFSMRFVDLNNYNFLVSMPNKFLYFQDLNNKMSQYGNSFNLFTNFSYLNSLFYLPYDFKRSPFNFFEFYLNNSLISSLYYSSYYSNLFVDNFKFPFSNDFEQFLSNLSYQTKNLDSSGRFSRVKTHMSRFDHIFTYREYEKFKKEHHRQRFRGVIPHWLQQAPRRTSLRYLTGPKRSLKFTSAVLIDSPSEITSPHAVLNQVIPAKHSWSQFTFKKRSGFFSRSINRRSSPSNLRFLNNVSFFIPYQYSRWFNHNPKLSTFVSNKFINFYESNNFAELDSIYIHFLFLLKRKIMFDVFSLRLSSQQYDVLYNVSLNLSVADFNKLILSYGYSTFITKFLFFFVRFFLTFYFFIFDFSTFSLMSPNFFSYYLFPLRSQLVFDFFSSPTYIRLLTNSFVVSYLQGSAETISSNERIAIKKSFSEIALYGRYKPDPLAITNLSYRGNFIRSFERKFRRIPFIDFYLKQSRVKGFQKKDIKFYQLFDNFLFYNFFFGMDDSIVRGDRVYAIGKQRHWRYAPFLVVSPQIPFSKKSTALSSISRFNSEHLQSFLNLISSNGNNFVTLPLKFKLFFWKHRLFVSSSTDSSGYLLGYRFKFNPSQQFYLPETSDSQMDIRFPFFDHPFLSRTFHSSKSLNSNWSEFQYNPYHLVYWQSFLHKASSLDLLGVRRFKFNISIPANISISSELLKKSSISHLVTLQIPIGDVNGLGRFSYKLPVSSNFYLSYYPVLKSFLNTLPDYSNQKLLYRLSQNSDYFTNHHMLRFRDKTRYPWYEFSPFSYLISLKFRRRMRHHLWQIKFILGLVSFRDKNYPSFLNFAEFYATPEQLAFGRLFLDTYKFNYFFPLKIHPSYGYGFSMVEKFPFNPLSLRDFKISSLSKRITRALYSSSIPKLLLPQGYSSYLDSKTLFDPSMQTTASVSSVFFASNSRVHNVSLYYTDVKNILLSDMMKTGMNFNYRFRRGFHFFHIDKDRPLLLKLKPANIESFVRSYYNRFHLLFKDRKLFPKIKDRELQKLLIQNYKVSYDIRPNNKFSTVFSSQFWDRPSSKFIKYSNYLNEMPFFRIFVLNSLNFLGFSYLKSPIFAQSLFLPNYQVIFNFNGYKQRYNIGLLFRGPLFESDLLYVKARQLDPLFFSFPFSFNFEDYKKKIISNSVNYDEFNIPFSSLWSNSSFQFLNFDHYYFFLLSNFHYFFIVLLDVYLSFIFILFYLMSYLQSFDLFQFSVFQFTWFDYVYGPNKSFFSFFFFHSGLIRNFLNFIWFVKLKFLLFNLDYLLFYFLFFFCISYILTFSNLNLKKDPSLFFPYIWRVSEERREPFNFSKIFSYQFDEDWYSQTLNSVLRDFATISHKERYVNNKDSLKLDWNFFSIYKSESTSSDSFSDLLVNSRSKRFFLNFSKPNRQKALSRQRPVTKLSRFKVAHRTPPNFSMFISDKIIPNGKSFKSFFQKDSFSYSYNGSSQQPPYFSDVGGVGVNKSDFWSNTIKTFPYVDKYPLYNLNKEMPVFGFPTRLSRLHYLIDVPTDGRLGPKPMNVFSKFYFRPALFPIKDPTYFVFNGEYVPENFDEFLRFFSDKLHSSYKLSSLSTDHSLIVDPEYVKLLIIFNRLKRLKMLNQRISSRAYWSVYNTKVNRSEFFYDDTRSPLIPGIERAYSDSSYFSNTNDFKYWMYLALTDQKKDYPFLPYNRYFVPFLLIAYNHILVFAFFFLLVFFFTIFFLLLFFFYDLFFV